MAVSLLGPLLVDGGGHLSPRDRVVLSALAVRSGDVLSAEQLADALWGEDPPASWPKIVQGCVARLRRSLGRDAVETTSGGYRLALADEEIDLRRFEALLGRARELAGQGEHDRAAAVLGQALALWRGGALADVEGWPAGRTEATRLEELRLSAQEALLVERAAAGQDVAADASALVAAQPLREGRWHLLAVALYRNGRQSDALSALREARRTLQDELGLDPGRDLVDLERAILNHDAGLAAPTASAAWDTGVCPYQGLVVYDRGDADRFFGRDEETRACLRILRDGPLLVVAGPSGCGKSSLVRAGVIPRAERSGGKVVLITPGAQPAAALAGALAAPVRDLVLVVDQLEELFTGGQAPKVVAQFLDSLVALAQSGRGVVLVVRAEQLGEFARSPGAARLVESGLHLVPSMTREELREAIEGPARQAGLRLEPGLVELLVRDVENEPGALPLLSHALAETWERREAGVLTVEGYRATGGIRGAVAQSAEALWESLPVDQRADVRTLLLRLVTLSPDGDPAAARASLASVRGDPARERVLDLLTRCRLVTTDERTVTLAHEALARVWPRLRSWLDEDVAGQQLLRHLTVASDDWQARGRPDSELYRGARLSSALDWRTRATPSLTTTETEFLNASQALMAAEQRAARARARRERIALVATAMGLVAALVAGLVAVQQNRQATRTARTALVDQLIAQSVALRATQRDLAALLAVEAYRLRPSAATRGALLGVVTATPGFLGYRTTDAPLTGGHLLPDDRSLVAVGKDGVLRVVDSRTGRTMRRFPGPALAPVDARVSLSADATTAAEISWEGPEQGGGRATLAVYDVAAGTRRTTDTRLPLDSGAVAVSPSGRFVAVSGYDDGRVLVFDTAGRDRLPELGSVDDRAPGVRQLATVGSAAAFSGPRHTAGLTFTPQGLLVVGSEVGIVRLVDPVTGEVRRRLTGAPDLTSNNVAAVSPDGSVLVTGGSRAVVRWDLNTGRPAWTAALSEGRCHSLAISVRTGAALCGGEFARVVALDIRTGRETGTSYDFQRGEVSDLILTRDGRTLVQLGGTEPVLAGWRLDGRGPLARLLPVRGTPTAYNADSRLLLVTEPDRENSGTGSQHAAVTILDAGTGSEMSRFGPDELGPVWTRHPYEVVVWTDTGDGFLVDVRTHQRIRRLEGSLGNPAVDGVLSGDGRHLLGWDTNVAGAQQVWDVWNLRTGELEGSHPTFPGGRGSLSRDGRVAVWSGGGVLATYEVASRDLLATRAGVVLGVESPTGVVAASSPEGRLTFLNQRSLTPVGPPAAASIGRARQLVFSQDGSLLIVHSGDGGVRLFDVGDRLQLGERLDLGSENASDVALSPDGLTLAVAHPEGVLVWDLSPAHWLTAACQVAGRSLSDEERRTYAAAVGSHPSPCRVS